MPILIITEKTSQARDLRAALGDQFAQILPAEGHLLRLAEPHDAATPKGRRPRKVKNASRRQMSERKQDGPEPTGIRPANASDQPNGRFREAACQRQTGHPAIRL